MRASDKGFRLKGAPEPEIRRDPSQNEWNVVCWPPLDSTMWTNMMTSNKTIRNKPRQDRRADLRLSRLESGRNPRRKTDFRPGNTIASHSEDDDFKQNNM